jgi:EpsI family protein
MTELKTILVPLFLAGQALLVHWTGSFEHPPAMPDLKTFRPQFDGWRRITDDPVDSATRAQLGADRLMNSMYVAQPANEMVNLFVAWFQSQRAGTSQPHSPQVCLPASGWVPESIVPVELETTAGKITVNRYVISKGTEKIVVMYWYQTPRRVIAGEWAAKFWLMADAPRDRRTDTSLVRVTAWVHNGSDVAAATKVAADFSRSVYPVLRQTLP